MQSDNNDFAKGGQNFANEPILQLTLREIQTIISNPRFWIGFVAVVALLAITGPFGTHESMDMSARLVYWATIALVTFFTGSAIATGIGIYFERRKWPAWLNWFMGGLAAGLPVGTITWLLNTLLFDVPIERTFSFPEFIAYSSAITIMVVTLFYLLSDKTTLQDPAREITASTSQSSFFRRLPKHLGNQLISLEAQDHYVNVTTTKGNELILMRLGDAQNELESYPGLRVHRSWWVAQDAILEIKRTSGKMELVLQNNKIVPVSRGNMKNVTKLKP